MRKVKGDSSSICLICNKDEHETESCNVLHAGVRLPDSIPPQRAFLTLPQGLKCSGRESGEYDVICEKQIPKGTQFGPFQSPKIKDFTFTPSRHPPLPIFKGKEILHYVDTSNLDRCNWMALVRFAKEEGDSPSFSSSNTICYQLKNEIYFSTVGDIMPGDPLVVGYSPGYSSLIKESGMKVVERIEVESNKLKDGNMMDHDYTCVDIGKVKDIEKDEKSQEEEDEDDIPLRKRYHLNCKSSKKAVDSKENVSPKADTKNREEEEGRIWTCKLCGSKVNNIREFADHLIQHYDKANTLEPLTFLTCDICMNKRIFRRAENIVRHIRQAHPRKMGPEINEECLHCKKCDHYFRDSKWFESHPCDVLASKKTSCALCKENFDDEKELNVHLMQHQDQEWVCTICSKALDNSGFKTHTMGCEKLARFRAGLESVDCCWSGCDFQGLSLEDFLEHFPDHTHPFQCPNCSLQLRNSASLKRHRCQQFPCDVCHVNFGTLMALRNHITEGHDVLCTIQNCFECAIPFATKDGYLAHECCEPTYPRKVQIRKSRTYICEVCGAAYRNVRSFKSHSLTHKGRPFSCEQCGKRFHRKEGLQLHSFVHEEAQFSCAECGRLLKSWKSLEVHKRIHTDQKPFTCTSCGKGFTQKINLQTHLRTHLTPTEKKTVVCDFPGCGKLFASRVYLKRHLDVHSGLAKFVCDICEVRFVKSFLLDRHRRVVHSSNIYFCEFCSSSKQFRYKDSLLRHLTKEHSEHNDVWSAEGYLSKVIRPEQASVKAPTSGSRIVTTKRKRAKLKQNEPTTNTVEATPPEPDTFADIEFSVAPIMVNTSDQSVSEEITLEIAKEVVVGEGMDEGQPFIRLDNNGNENTGAGNSALQPDEESGNNNGNMILLQLGGEDNDRYVIAFSQDLTLR